MESEARYLWVGGMVLALLLLLAGAVWWLQGGEDKEVRRYLVYFQNQSLEGLQINSDVRMQGIKVGKVMDYVILPNQAKTVRVVLEVDARTPVLEGVEAVVSRNLVTGLAAVDLNNVWKGGGPLTRIPKGEEYVVIDEGVPEIARFAKNIEDLGNAGQDALVRFSRLLSDDNQRSVRALLDNLAGLSGEARQRLPEVSETLAAIRHSAGQVDGAVQSLAPAVRDAGQSVRVAGQRLDALAGEAEATLRATRTTLGALDAGLRDTQIRLRLSADLGLQEIQRAAQSMRAAGDTVQTAGRDYADPGRLLFGPHKAELGPGEAP